MDFLSWFYTDGLLYYLRHLGFYLAWYSHYFTFPLLLKSFFSPWKRLLVEENRSGFNIRKYFEDLSFNLVSRGIGAIVRLFLFFSGLIIILLTASIGSLGFMLWILMPVMGLGVYLRYKQKPQLIVGKIVSYAKSNPQKTFELIFQSDPGKFVLSKIPITFDELSKVANKNEQLPAAFQAQSFEEVMKWFVSVNPQIEESLRKSWVTLNDFVISASWWDSQKKAISNIDTQFRFGRPGIGLQLLFGYTPELNKYASDMSAPQSFSHHWIGRGDVVGRMERVLMTGKSVVITGLPGVGKKTVVLEFARRAAWGELGAAMSYKRILEFDYNSILSQSFDLNTKKSILSYVLREASAAGNVILVVKDIQKLTNKSSEGFDFTEIFETAMQSGDLKVIALSSNADYERFIAPNMRLRKYMDVVEVVAPSKEDALLITINAAQAWERSKNILITVPALRRIVEATDKYITEAPFPEKALDLLDDVVMFAVSQKQPELTVEMVNTILSEKTGIPFARLTEMEKEKLSVLEDIIHEKLVNQETAVSQIAKSLRARSVGVRDEEKPVGSFLFLGPTGVGKTQTAKVLAEVYYGSVTNITRFDMSEFAGSEGLSRLIGSQVFNQPGILTTAIKNKPAGLLLLDEIEKAPAEVFNLFLTLLDEGYITDAFGRKVDCRHLFVIATSNAGAEYVREEISKGAKGEQLQKDVLNYIQEKGIFTPEFLNRFDGTVVFEPLTEEHLVDVARLLLSDFSLSLKKQNIYLDVTDELCRKIAKDGYDPAFGARPMRRVVDLVLGDLVGKAILKKEIAERSKIRIIPGEGDKQYSLESIG